MSKINLAEKFAKFSNHWSPRIVAEMNGQYVKLAKVQGEIVWHKHDNEDEMFLVTKGRLTIQMRAASITLEPGKFFIVPKGVEHAPKAEEETHIVLFEPKATAHTGDTVSDMTVPVEQQEWV